MDLFRAQIDRFQQHFATLSASQRMLVVSLVAIMVMTLVWWARYAGNAEMRPLLNQALSDAEISRITSHLDQKGIAYSVSADRMVLVPTNRQTAALAELGYNQLLPENMVDAWAEYNVSSNPFDSAEKTEYSYNRYNEVRLSQVISQFRGVRSATVAIDRTSERRIGSAAVTPSATIAIFTHEGIEPDPRLADAAASLVAHAVAELKKNRISVVVNSRRVHLPDEDEAYSAAGTTLFEQQRAVEKYYLDKVERAIAQITPGAIVQLEVDLSNEFVQSESTTYDPDGVVAKPAEEEIRSTVSTRSDPVGGEPGAVANAALSVGEALPPSSSDENSEDYTRTRFENKYSTKHTITRSGPGKEQVTAAAVAIPRSFLVRLYKKGNPTAQDPDDEALAGIAEQQLDTVRGLVHAATSLPREKIFADIYPDLPIEVTDLAEVSTAAGTSLAGAFGSYGKEIAVGVLAVVSLLMVSVMVKKGAAPPVVVGRSSEPQVPPQLEAGEAIAGVVGDGDNMLDGMELDEDAVRTQQMLDQVQTLVKENPDAAATLVQRWLNRA